MCTLQLQSMDVVPLPPKQSIVYPPQTVATALFKKYVDDNTFSLLKALRILISTHHNNEATGKKFYDQVINAGTKVAFLFRQKYINRQEVETCRFPFKRICSSISNAFRYLHLQSPDTATIKRIIDMITLFKNSVSTLLYPYFSDEDIHGVQEFLDYVSDPVFLEFCFKNPEQFKPVVFTFSYYLDIS